MSVWAWIFVLPLGLQKYFRFFPRLLIVFSWESGQRGRTQKEWESGFGIKQYFAREILSDFSRVCSDLKKYLLNLSVDELYITFDIDVLDISHAPCTGTPESDGLDLHHCVSLIEMLAKDYLVGGVDLMEVAPLVRNDKNNRQTTLASVRTVSRALLHALSR